MKKETGNIKVFQADQEEIQQFKKLSNNQLANDQIIPFEHTYVPSQKSRKFKLIFILITTLKILTILTLTNLSLRRKEDITAIILVVDNNHRQSLQTIKQFTQGIFAKEIDDVVVGISSSMNCLQMILSEYKIKYAVAEKFPYQAQFLDSLVEPINTTYYFLTTSQWKFQNQAFFPYARQIMRSNPKIRQVVYPEAQGLNSHILNTKSSQSDSSTSLTSSQTLTNLKKSFSFSPSLHLKKFFRMHNYHRKYSDIIGPSTILNLHSQIQLQTYYSSRHVLIHYATQFSSQRITKQNHFQKYTENNLQEYYQHMKKYLKQGQKIFGVQKIQVYNQLSFCLILLPSDKYSQQTLMNSILKQNYLNFVHIIGKQQDKVLDYFSLHTLIKQICNKNSVIMFVSTPLQQDSIKNLNIIHQTHLAWLTYSQSSESIQIFTFYQRIYQMLQKSDFIKTNHKFLLNNTIQIQSLALLQLCAIKNKKIQKYTVISKEDNAYLKFDKYSKAQYKRIPYTMIERLSQDMPSDVYYIIRMKQQRFNIPMVTWTSMTKQHIRYAAQRQQQPYLPQNHSIVQIQYLEFKQKYGIDKYEGIDGKQIRFCITVLSHNNIQNDRYKKVLKTITQQKYSNYHIVFIDDFSDDDNLRASINSLKQINFPSDRVTIIANTGRNYATYNIINSAFNFCKEDEVQLLIDGDDQFIGKYALQMMNSAYQSNPDLWMVYSNCKSNYYEPGWSANIKNQTLMHHNGKRNLVSDIAPIRSWRVKVLRNIPLSYHLMKNGAWLDTGYDEAIHHSIFQLSTFTRVSYIPEISYQYNTNYGDNDNSNQQKLKHRQWASKHVSNMKLLKPLAKLQDATPNLDVISQLEKGKRRKYQIIKY